MGKVSMVEDYNGKIVKYSRNKKGKVSSIVYPDGKTISYSYNSVGKIDSIFTLWVLQMVMLVICKKK